MVNKKGYIRTLEAIITLIIVFIFILSILPHKESFEESPKDIDLTGEQILNEIQNNNELRNAALGVIFNNNEPDKNYIAIKSFINSTIPLTIGYEIVICGVNNGCYPAETSQLDLPKVSIYTKSVLINSNAGDRIVKLLLWRKV